MFKKKKSNVKNAKESLHLSWGMGDMRRSGFIVNLCDHELICGFKNTWVDAITLTSVQCHRNQCNPLQ